MAKTSLEKVEKQVGGDRMGRVEITVFEKCGCKQRERNIMIGGEIFFFLRWDQDLSTFLCP